MSVPHKPILYIISAPSGSGKSTLVNELLKLVANLDFSISYTTRAPRGSEQNGKEYYFVTRAEFERMIHAGEFLEHANVFGKDLYGTARRFLNDAEQKGRDLLLDIDVQGAAQVKQKVPESVSIFVLPPDRKTLEWRLRKRGEDAPEVIQRRLDRASREIEDYDKFNYILINDVLERSIETLQDIVMSERLQQQGRPPAGEEEQVAKRAERYRLANIQDRIKPILESFRNSPPSAQ